uniref:FAD dependent oxidoreductase domain-containing protein n=1 Tax=Chaetoceros debilis TaxID=122233 RepID=A0A7S3VB26_9STRA|mmetsp:Transcript_3521/g.5205  ORF Transcript_3521/g.5205 Transcript_3521/m.5205 type:complete len:514 (-) Transcript_3521:1193-2734(-)
MCRYLCTLSMMIKIFMLRILACIIIVQCFATMNSEIPTSYDVVIIGGGVVGLAVLRAATLEGYKCALVESEADLLSHASGSNSGIACTGVDATPGTLERALIRDANSQFRIYCKTMNLPARPCGSLVCLWPWDATSKNDDFDSDGLDAVLEESHEAGDTHAKRIHLDRVLEMEPNLSSDCQGAVHIPGEIVVDPFLYSVSLAVHARENGADIFTNFEFDPGASSFDGSGWNVVRKINVNENSVEEKEEDSNTRSSDNDNDSNSNPMHLRARAIVNAGGLWAEILQSKGHGTSKWKAKPRRGQYRIYSSTNETIIHHPIQPVPTQFTKGVFVFSTLYDQIVVGPTALDQESKIDRSIDDQVADELDAVVRRIIPSLNTEEAHVGEYVGIRPGTDQRDYQIHLFPKEHWIAVAGIRSTGLTASLGIGNYVLRNLKSVLDSAPGMNIDTDIDTDDGRQMTTQTTPLPPLDTLVENYHTRNDGCVDINGHAYRVTHPLTRIGWTKRSGLASTCRAKY